MTGTVVETPAAAVERPNAATYRPKSFLGRARARLACCDAGDESGGGSCGVRSIPARLTLARRGPVTTCEFLPPIAAGGFYCPVRFRPIPLFPTAGRFGAPQKPARRR